MKIAIVEPNDCHFELFPTWSYLLEGHDVDYWVTKRAHKMGAFSLLLSPPNKVFGSLRFPLYSAIDRWRFNSEDYDAVIFNTERYYKKHSDLSSILPKLNCPLILVNNHRPLENVTDDKRVKNLSISPIFGESHIAPIYFSTEEPFRHDYGKYFIIPGTVTTGRRFYEIVPRILEALPPDVKVMALGKMKAKSKGVIKEFITHPKFILNDRDLAFRPFINLVKKSLGILSLIEPQMPNFNHYISDTQSGNLNLSLGLGVPIIANEDYLSHVPDFFGSGLPYQSDYKNLSEVLLRAMKYDNSELLSRRKQSLKQSRALLNSHLDCLD